MPEPVLSLLAGLLASLSEPALVDLLRTVQGEIDRRYPADEPEPVDTPF